MPSIIIIVLILAAVIGIAAGLSKAVISGCVWFVGGLVVQALFGGIIVSLASAIGISLAASSIPVVFAIIGVVVSFAKG